MSLYAQLHNRDNLLAAWRGVRDKGAAGGIDGVSIQAFEERFDENMQSLQTELSAGKFVPQPYQEIKIPKGEGEYRSLGLMTVRDKIVQQAAREVLEPILDRMFLDVSYGYRKDKGTARAIGRVNHLITNEKREWLVRCDIDSYFDTINHDRLMTMLGKRIDDKPFLDLVRVWISMGKIDGRQRWKDSRLGIPQGGVISPLLSNFYLNPLDHFAVGRKLGYVRYADDFLVLCRGREEADNALTAISGFLQDKLKLKLNEGNAVTHISKGFTFLGITFTDRDRSITNEKLASIQTKIRNAVFRDRLTGTKETDDACRGVAAYYAKVLPQSYIERFDEALAQALKDAARKALETKQLKGKRHLADYLRRVSFLSTAWQTRANKEIREIVEYAFRREPAVAPSEQPAAPVAKAPSRRGADPVLKRKREYQKLEAEGFELVVSRPGAFVGKTQKGIVVKVGGKTVHQAPLLNLKHIMITSANVSLSANVISHAVRNRIPIDFIEHAGLPYARVTGFHGTSVKLQLAQLEALGNGKASELAKRFVLGKIRNQQNLAKYYHKYRKVVDEAFVKEYIEEMARMEAIEEEIKNLADTDHDTLRGKLFSIEGRSAAAYWDIVRTLLDEIIYFEGRVGQGAKDLVNSLLNYGYGILYTKIWQAVVRAGLNPYISYLHVPQAGKPTLLYDLIEEFRPQAVDRAVFSMINKRVELKMDKGLLDPETRNKVATAVLERINTVEKFRGRELRLGDIIAEQTRAVAAYLLGEKDRYAPYIAKW